VDQLLIFFEQTPLLV